MKKMSERNFLDTKLRAYGLLFSTSRQSSRLEIHKLITLLTHSREIFDTSCLNAGLSYHCKIGKLVLVDALVSCGACLENKDDHGNTPLLLAIINNHVDVAKYLIDHGCNINACNSDGDTPLIILARCKTSYDVVELLLQDLYLNLEHENNKSYTALMTALEFDNVMAVKLLIDAGASFNVNWTLTDNLCAEKIAVDKAMFQFVKLLKLHKETGRCPVQEAVLARDLVCLKLLINKSLSTLVQNSDKFLTIIYEFLLSIKRLYRKRPIRLIKFTTKDYDILRILLESIDVSKAAKAKFDDIIELATELGDIEVVVMFCRHGIPVTHQAVCNAVANKNIQMLEILLQFKGEINRLNKKKSPRYYRSALEKALKIGQIDCAEVLISHGAYIELEPAIHAAIKHYKENSLKFLMTHYKNEVKPIFDNSHDIFESFLKRKRGKDEMILPLLIENGGIKSFEFFSYLWNYVSLKKLQCLVKFGFDVNQKDYFGESFVFSCVAKGDKIMLQWLLEHGADINIRCNNGRTPVFYLDPESADNVFTILLAHNIDVTIVDNYGNSLLICLIQKQSYYNSYSLNIFKQLLTFNIDINHKNNDGINALTVAAKRLNPDLMTLLITQGADIDGNTATSIVKTLFQNMCDYPTKASSCLAVLIDHAANVAQFPDSTIHILISSGCCSLVPKLISLGLAPRDIELQSNEFDWAQANLKLSPFKLALFLDNLELAEYLFSIGYLTPSDLQVWSNSKSLIESSLKQNRECINLILDITAVPLSLKTLSLIVISDALQSDPRRSEKIKMTGLPVPLQNILLYKGKEIALAHKTTRNLSVYRAALNKA